MRSKDLFIGMSVFAPYESELHVHSGCVFIVMKVKIIHD